MPRRTTALLFATVVGCNGTQAPPAGPGSVNEGTTPTSTASAVATAAPKGVGDTEAATPVPAPLPSKPAPTFTLPRPLPPVAKALDPGISPPTLASLVAASETAKVGTDVHAKACRRLAEACRARELSFADEAAAKVAGAATDAKAKKAFLAARKDYELMRSCVLVAYRKVADDDPKFSAGDEILHALAAEQDDRRVFVAAEDGPLVEEEQKKALATSLELIKRFPQSRFVVGAYRRFADFYFDEAMRGTTDWMIAETAYLRVRDGIDPALGIENAYANYRLGYVAWNRGDVKVARKFLRTAIDATTLYPALPHAVELLAAANIALSQLP